MVPNGWVVKNLDSIYRVIDSLHQTPSFSKDGEYRMVRVTDIKGKNLDLSNAVRVSKEVFLEYTKKYKPKRNDILFSRVGSYGISSFIHTDQEFCLGQNTVIAESNDQANPIYIFNVLKSEGIRRQVEKTVDGSSHKTVSLKVIKDLKIPLAPRKEQNKIAQILSTWDQAISVTEKLLENSQEQKKALMQQLLTGKKRLLDENGVKFSNEWATKNLESLVYRPLCYGVLKPGEDVLDGHPLIRIQDIDDRGFIDIRKVIRITDELHYEFRRTILNTNDLIISIVGTLGKVFVIPKELNGANITRAFAVIGADCKLIDTRFIYQYLNSSMIQEWLLNTATGNAQKVLNIAALKELQIPLPIIEEQRRIAEVLFVADQEIETIQKKLDCLKQEKKALMQQLLTGKKRVMVAA